MNKKQHSLYSTWKNMKDRCYSKTRSNYRFYGARGITVCKRWHDFWNFVYDIDNHMPNGHLLYKKGWQLDKDSKGGNIYNLENCTVIFAEVNRKLAYEKQQREIFVVKEGQEVKFNSISKASRDLGIPRNTIQLYLKNGKQHPAGYFFKYCS